MKTIFDCNQNRSPFHKAFAAPKTGEDSSLGSIDPTCRVMGTKRPHGTYFDDVPDGKFHRACFDNLRISPNNYTLTPRQRIWNPNGSNFAYVASVGSEFSGGKA